jgi:hypothetical protein
MSKSRHRLSRLALVASVAAAAAVGVAVFATRGGGGGGSAAAAPAGPHAGLVPRIRYRVTYDQRIDLPGRAPVSLAVRGAWTTTPRADGRIEARFALDTIEGPQGSLPTAAALAPPVQLVQTDGVLTAMAFPAAMPGAARALVTGLATAFQYTDRAGVRWAAAEEDLTGRYEAAYTRDGAAAQRTRAAYTAMRGREGLSAAAARDAAPAETSRFTLDAHGVVTAEVAIDLRVSMGEGAPTVHTKLRGSLAREAIEWVAPPSGPTLPAGPIFDHVDHVAAARSADRAAVAGASVAQLLAEVARVAALDARVPAIRNERSQLLARLTAAVRLDPAAAAELAAAMRAPGASASAVKLMAGALASTRLAIGTDTLAGLAREELPVEGARAILHALALSTPPTAASFDVLGAALDGSLEGADPDAAALGLGSHVHHGHGEHPVAAAAATEALVARYRGAAGDTERARYVAALGNGGTAAALPVLRDAIAGGGVTAEAAVFGLRFVPGAEADALLADALGREELAFAAVRAAGHRDAAAWGPRLEEARRKFPDHAGLQLEAQGILRRWGVI